MALSHADRAALQARAAGLREEVSSLRTAATDSTNEASAAIEDAKLFAEVESLERQKAEASEQLVNSRGTVADAMAAMEAAAAKLEEKPEVVQEDLSATPDAAPNVVTSDDVPGVSVAEASVEEPVDAAPVEATTDTTTETQPAAGGGESFQPGLLFTSHITGEEG